MFCDHCSGPMERAPELDSKSYGQIVSWAYRCNAQGCGMVVLWTLREAVRR